MNAPQHTPMMQQYLALKREAGEALRFATAAACLCVQRKGAQPSLPRRDEVEALASVRAAELTGRRATPSAVTVMPEGEPRASGAGTGWNVR